MAAIDRYTLVEIFFTGAMLAYEYSRPTAPLY